MTTPEEKNEVINTKCSLSTKARLEAICEERGITIYQMLQMVVDTLVRYMDKETNLSADINKVMRMFEGMKGWDHAFNLCRLDDAKIREAFYVLTGGKKEDGERIVHVNKEPELGEQMMTFNVQEILERFISIVNPSLYSHLRTIGAEMGVNSIYEILTRLADEYMENPDEAELRLAFENNNWVERANYQDGKRYGAQQEGVQYKRTRTTSMESFERSITREEDY